MWATWVVWTLCLATPRWVQGQEGNLEGYRIQPFTGTLLYNRDVAEPLNVKVGYALIRLMNVDEQAQTYKVRWEPHHFEWAANGQGNESRMGAGRVGR